MEKNELNSVLATSQIQTILLHNSVNLRGKHILFRLLRTEDINDRYTSWMNDSRVTQFLESRFEVHTVDSLVKQFHNYTQNNDTLFFALVEIGSGLHIGNLKVGPINFRHSIAEIGLLIGEPECWGKGYATEAIHLVTEYLIGSGVVKRLFCGAYATNLGSINAFLKCGYKIEGVRVGHVLNNGIREDTLIFGFNSF